MHSATLGHDIDRGTIAEIVLKQHWDLIVAADFFTIEAWTRRGLQRFVMLFFIRVVNTEDRNRWYANGERNHQGLNK